MPTLISWGCVLSESPFFIISLVNVCGLESCVMIGSNHQRWQCYMSKRKPLRGTYCAQLNSAARILRHRFRPPACIRTNVEVNTREMYVEFTGASLNSLQNEEFLTENDDFPGSKLQNNPDNYAVKQLKR
ncbi:hypothetical protein AC249_AIPGENE19426 [Exaiptasia diaphana]|nr:hypothetical protein AC249_AIPGENE19426 [Exaiptasia diaphana]